MYVSLLGEVDVNVAIRVSGMGEFDAKEVMHGAIEVYLKIRFGRE